MRISQAGLESLPPASGGVPEGTAEAAEETRTVGAADLLAGPSICGGTLSRREAAIKGDNFFPPAEQAPESPEQPAA